MISRFFIVVCVLLSFSFSPVLAAETRNAKTTEEFLSVLSGFDPLIEAQIDYSKHMLEFFGQSKTSQKDGAVDQEMDAVVKSFSSLPFPFECTERIQIDMRRATIFQFAQVDLVVAQYISHVLKDIYASIRGSDSEYLNPFVQGSLKDLLNAVAYSYQSTVNEISNLFELAIQKEGFGQKVVPTGATRYRFYIFQELCGSKYDRIASLINFLTKDNPRGETLNRVFKDLDLLTMRIPELEHQLQLCMFYGEIERKLREFIPDLPASFDKLIICDESKYSMGQELIRFGRNKTDGYIRFLAQKEGIVGRSGAYKSQETTYKNKTLGGCVINKSEMGNFIQSKYTSLTDMIFLKRGEDFLPPPAQKNLINGRRNALQEKKRKEIERARAEQLKLLAAQKPVVTESIGLPSSISVPDAPDEVIAAPFHQENGTPQDVVAEVEQNQNQDQDQEWDYWEWRKTQVFPEKETFSVPSEGDLTQKTVLKRPELTKGAEDFSSAVFGGGKNVTQDDFDEFLRQVGGAKYKHTTSGLKPIRLNDPSVEIWYSVPNLADPVETGAHRFFKIHQPHSGQSFLRHTLISFIRPQLESAGYAPWGIIPSPVPVAIVGDTPDADAVTKVKARRKKK